MTTTSAKDEQPSHLQANYNDDGPYESLYTRHFSLTVRLSNQSVTVATSLSSPSPPFDTPLPLVVMISGFQLVSSLYDSYAHRLATWGYSVLRYDLPRLSPLFPLLRKILTDEDEVAFVLPAIIEWAASLSGGSLDASRVAFVGHSRGGKLCALALLKAMDKAPRPEHLALVMIDPVDMTDVTRDKPGFPSAFAQLDGRGVRALLLRSEIIGRCNPQPEGPEKFWGVLSPGTWMIQARGSGHVSYTDSNGAIGWALDMLCGGGRGEGVHEGSRFVAQGSAVAWLDQELRRNSNTDYLRWAIDEEMRRDGLISSLVVKS